MPSPARRRRPRHRGVDLVALAGELDGYPAICRARWSASVHDNTPTDRLPPSFADAIDPVTTFADPILAGTAGPSAAWDPATRMWERAHRELVEHTVKKADIRCSTTVLGFNPT